jgi:predicted patatin/cPLA2 family phospholipase
MSERAPQPSSLLGRDERKIGVVVQGGGMRGTYSISALAELDRLGLRPSVHTMGGSSAGAMNAAYFAAGQAEVGVSIYTDHISNRHFVNRLRYPIVDIDFLVDKILKRDVRLDVNQVLSGEIVIRALLADSRTGTGREFTQQNVYDGDMFFEVLRAGAALPLVFGKEIPVGDGTYVDGGLAETLYTSWLRTSALTDIVIILTRPLDFSPPKPGRITARLMRLLSSAVGHSSAVTTALGRVDRTYANRLAALNHPLDGNVTSDPLRVWVVAPSDAKRLCGRLTTDRGLLRETAELARSDAARAARLEPILVSRHDLTR